MIRVIIHIFVLAWSLAFILLYVRGDHTYTFVSFYNNQSLNIVVYKCTIKIVVLLLLKRRTYQQIFIRNVHVNAGNYFSTKT